MTNYLADPGGRFASDTHRRVLGHLTYPDDDYGWSLPALYTRMAPDVGTSFQSQQELQQVLDKLEADGHAQKVGVGGQDIWKMTQTGFNVLTGSIANEPPPGAAVVGPAAIDAPGAATRINGAGPTVEVTDAAN